jgi:hypothetical protein
MASSKNNSAASSSRSMWIFSPAFTPVGANRGQRTENCRAQLVQFGHGAVYAHLWSTIHATESRSATQPYDPPLRLPQGHMGLEYHHTCAPHQHSASPFCIPICLQESGDRRPCSAVCCTQPSAGCSPEEKKLGHPTLFQQVFTQYYSHHGVHTEHRDGAKPLQCNGVSISIPRAMQDCIKVFQCLCLLYRV